MITVGTVLDGWRVSMKAYTISVDTMDAVLH